MSGQHEQRQRAEELDEEPWRILERFVEENQWMQRLDQVELELEQLKTQFKELRAENRRMHELTFALENVDTLAGLSDSQRQAYIRLREQRDAGYQPHGHRSPGSIKEMNGHLYVNTTTASALVKRGLVEEVGVETFRRDRSRQPGLYLVD